MKNFAMLVLCSSVLALTLTSNRAKASPTSAEDHSTISEVVLTEMATPFVITPITKFEILCEVNFVPALPASDVAAVPSTVDTVKPVKNPASPDDGRIRMHRHYFNHEDNKEYPKYQVDKLSSGFIRPVDRPAV